MRIVKIILPMVALALLGFGCTKVNITPTPSSTTPAATSMDTSSWKSAQNTKCGFSLQYHADWSIGGMLGETTVISPEDVQANDAYTKAHPDNGQGEGGSQSLNARSLYIDCLPDIKSFTGQFSDSTTYKDFSEKTTLDELFSNGELRLGKNAGYKMIKRVVVGDQTGFEVTGINPSSNNYQIFIDHGYLYEIDLGNVEYDNLSPTVKQILATFTFTK